MNKDQDISDEKLDIAFLGGIFPEEMIEDITNNSIGNVQNASNKLQKDYIYGIEKINSNGIKIINAPFIGSFPRNYKKAKIKRRRFSHTEGSKDISVGFWNVSGINYFSKSRSLSKETLKWAKTKSSKQQKIIIAYSATYPMLYAISKAKLENPDIVACLITPDLPQYMIFANHSKLWHYMVNKLLISPSLKLLKFVDIYVVLTKYFIEKLPIENKPYVVIEGMHTDNGNESQEINSSEMKIRLNRRVIMYTGSLEQEYGILDLIDAFKLIDKSNYELWICGSGNAKEIVIDSTNEDERIRYYGQVTYKDSVELQQQADILINPRSSVSGEYTKYSFPSKTIEYMASGKPVMLKKLDGIPEEYYDYTYVIPDGTIEDMKNSINEVMSLSQKELEDMGKRGKEFILNEKNSIKQCEKLQKNIVEYLCHRKRD